MRTNHPSSEYDPEREFRAPTVCAVAGITYRQLDYWARTGLVTPSIAPASGSGTSRLYSFEDLVELRLIRALMDDGRSLQSIRDAVVVYREAVERYGEADALFMISDPAVGWEVVPEAEIDAARLTVVTIISLDWLRSDVEFDALPHRQAGRLRLAAV